MTPAADISDNQYGFRDGRGTGIACSLLNDVITHCKYQKSTLFVASLDAENVSTVYVIFFYLLN